MHNDDEKDFAPDIKTKDNEISIKEDNKDDVGIKEVEEQEIKTQEGVFDEIDDSEELPKLDTDDESEILTTNMYQLSADEPITEPKPLEDSIDVDKDFALEPKGKHNNIGKKIAKSVIAAPVSIAANTVKSSAKSLFGKANPLDKKINKADTSDTGVESLRLAFGSIKNGTNTIKTVQSSVKTVENTIKTTHRVYKTSKIIIYKTADNSKKAVVGVYKAVKFITSHIAAAIMNPIAAIAAVFLLLVVSSISSVIMLVASVSGVSGANASALTTATGLGEDEETIREKFEEGRAFFEKAVEDKRKGYTDIIDGLRYTESDWAHNDLIYLELYVPGETEPYVWKSAVDRGNRASYADPAWKVKLKNDVWRLGITYNEAAAIAYVYLEKTTGEGYSEGIHAVEYTQEVFDEIVSHCVEYSDSVVYNQGCPPDNCVIEDDRRYCKHEHTLHNVGIWVYDKNHVMDELGFTEEDKRWVELMEMGFERSSDLSSETDEEEVSE